MGDFALSPDGSFLVTWAQYGYGAGQAGSHLTRYAVAPDGTLTEQQATPNGYPNGLLREPYNTPILFLPDSESFYVKQYRVETTDLSNEIQTFGTQLYASSPDGALVSTQSRLLRASTGEELLPLPVTSRVQSITSDSLYLVYFDGIQRAIRSMDLVEEIGSEVLGVDIEPDDGAIVFRPERLAWSPLFGVNRYAIFSRCR